MFGDIGEPQLVGPIGSEPRRTLSVAVGGPLEPFRLPVDGMTERTLFWLQARQTRPSETTCPLCSSSSEISRYPILRIIRGHIDRGVGKVSVVPVPMRHRDRHPKAGTSPS